MAFRTRISRRDVIWGGMGAAAAAAMPKSISAAQASGLAEGLSVGGRVISVKSSSDSTFGADMDALFPGMRQDPRFHALASSFFLITNAKGPNVKALSLSWSFATSTGGYQRTVPIYHGKLFKNFSGAQSLMTARFDLVLKGGTLLVCPLFSLSPAGFEARPHSVWDSLRDSSELSPFLTQETKAASSITMQLDAVIYRDWGVAGPDAFNLAKYLRVRRNGEHDEAVKTLKLIRANPGKDEVTGTLAQRQTIQGAAGKDIPRTNTFLFSYWQARSLQARALLDRFQSADSDTFVRELTTIRNQPKTIPYRLAA
jgi:hypothetical protein